MPNGPQVAIRGLRSSMRYPIRCSVSIFRRQVKRLPLNICRNFKIFTWDFSPLVPSGIYHGILQKVLFKHSSRRYLKNPQRICFLLSQIHQRVFLWIVPNVALQIRIDTELRVALGTLLKEVSYRRSVGSNSSKECCTNNWLA